MKKAIKRILFLTVVVAAVWCAGLFADGQQLRNELIRLHVVGASDSDEDQQVKLQVRDAIIATLRQGLTDLGDADLAVSYIQSVLPKLTETANRVLREAGFSETATVSLTTEEFPLREYDTFSLPSGLYRSLRIVIGEGQGQNWWCVVFPELCLPATSEEFVEAASMEGMSESLSGALTGDYEIRFWVLDQFGKVRNFIHRDSE